MALTTADLLTEVKLKGNIPDTTDTNSVNHDSNILRLASSILLSRLVPAIMSVRQEFYVTTSEITVEAGRARYRMPSRGIGGLLRDVRLKCSTSERSLPEIPQERRCQVSSDAVRGYYLEHDEVVLYPTPISGGDTLILPYFLRPNRLALLTDCDTVTAVHDDYVETTGALTGVLTKDFIRADTPHAFLAVSSMVDFGSAGLNAVPEDLAIGDYVCPVDKSPVPQMPAEFFPILVSFTTAAVLRALGSADHAVHQNEAASDLANILDMLSPRTQGEMPKILSPW